jgi:PAS domain S-box-containing protein
VVFVLPVFSPMVPGSPVTGFVQSVFRIQTMLAQSHRPEDRTPALNCYYLDLDMAPDAPALLYANVAGREPLRDADPRLPLPALDNPGDWHDLITIGDRRWLLVIQMDQTWAHQQRTLQPFLVLAASLTITALLSLFIHTLLQRTTRVEREVTLRTAELRESETRLQAILDHSPAMIFVKDLGGHFVLYNQAFASVIRLPKERSGPFTDFDLFPPDLARGYQEWDRRVIASRAPVVFEENLTTAGGDTFICLTQKFPLLDADGHAYAVCGIATDITQRKQAELERQESRRQLDNLISQLPGAAFRCATDEMMTAQYASDGTLAICGYAPEDFISGRIHIGQLTEPADRPRIRQELAQALGERRSFEIEYRIRHRDGSERWVLVRGRPVYTDDGTLRFIEGLAIDVTALKQAELGKLAFERNLLETQKLESLGVMAGGIAHDFNNLLAAVLGNASLTRMALKPDDPGQANLLHIEKAALRAADLCSQMLAYAGKGKLTSALVDLSQLVKETTSLLEVSIGKNCELDLQLAGTLPPVLGDGAQLHQIVMNLVINASDAIAERIGGKISISTFARQAEPALFQSALHQPKLPAGLYVGLEVRDNGCGMTAEIVARIFDPFFTTKFSGRGLGLSAVLGIVQGHHGALFIESKPNEGSTFRLLLPAATPAPAPVQTPLAKPPAPSQPLRGKILIVDDEDAVRLVAGEMLRRNGATILLAADGTEALALFQQHRHTIDLILLDLTMPGLSGEDVLRQLQLFKVRAKIVIMSGYSEEETMQRCAELGVAGFLRKPFDLRTLLTKLQAHLG